MTDEQIRFFIKNYILPEIRKYKSESIEVFYKEKNGVYTVSIDGKEFKDSDIKSCLEEARGYFKGWF